jgi:hypothetical protein
VKTKILIPFLVPSLALVSGVAVPARAQINYTVSGSTAYVTRSPNASGNIVIASTFNGYPVTSVEFGAFSGCTNLTNVRIHNRITAIGNSTFSGCTSLTNVTIGDGVTIIENSVFRACTSLASITLPNSIITIREFAFEDCTNLSNVTLGSGVTTIWGFAFYNCTNLTNLTFLGNAPDLADDDAFDNIGPNATIYYYYGATGWGTSYGGLSTVMLDAPAPQLDTTAVQPGGFGFTITGVVNQTIVVEASANLATWQPVWTNTLFAVSTNFVDPQSPNHPRRFYRLRSN